MQISKTKIVLAALLPVMFFLGVMLVRSCYTEKTDLQEAEPKDSMTVLIQQVQQCSRLYTAEVDVHKIITHSDEVNLKSDGITKLLDVNIPLGERKIAIPVSATFKAYIDFSNFSARNVEKHGDFIEVILPDPQIVMTHTKVSNEEVKKLVPLLRHDFSDEELTNYEAQGRKSILQAIPKLNIIPMAQEGAAHVLIPLLEQMGYKEENIKVTFRKEFSYSEITRMLVND